MATKITKELQQKHLEVISHILFLVGSNKPIEVRLLPRTGNQILHGIFTTPESLVEGVLSREQTAYNFYMVPNPTTYDNPIGSFSGGSNSRDEHIPNLHWFLIDSDPERKLSVQDIVEQGYSEKDAKRIIRIQALLAQGVPLALAEHQANYEELLESGMSATEAEEFLKTAPKQKRPTNFPNVAATDAEKAFAEQKAQQVMEYLTSLGWPEPIRVDSGNGVQMLYRVNQPNTKEVVAFRSDVLNALNAKFGDSNVKVDVSVFNPARLYRLPGTFNRKGQPTPTRPHRFAKLLSVPKGFTLVSDEQLAKVCPTTTAPKLVATTQQALYTSDTLSAEDVKEFELKLAACKLNWKRVSDGKKGYKYCLLECPMGTGHDKSCFSDTVIFLRADGSRGFECAHAHCKGFGWQDVRNKLEEDYPEVEWGRVDKELNLSEQEAEDLFGTSVVKQAQAKAELAKAEAVKAVKAITKLPVVDIPEDDNPPFPTECMYGWCGEKAIEIGTPLSLAYPAMLAVASVLTPSVENIRNNLYVPLLGRIGTGKSVSAERAIQTIMWDDDTTVSWKVPGSDKGLYKIFDHELPYPKAVMLAQDELKNMFSSKIQIKGSALPFVLCELWGKDSAGSSSKDTDDDVKLHLSLLGGLKCDDAVEFQSIFGQSTTDGLTRRCIYGLAPKEWDWQPVKIIPESQAHFPFYTVHVPQHIWNTLTAWKKAKHGRTNLGENLMRVALITAFMNHDQEITVECFECAARFMEWQERIQELYKAGEAETKEAEVESIILRSLEKLPVGQPTDWWKLYKNKHLDRKGSNLVNRVRDTLAHEDVIGYDKGTKTIWRKK